MLKKDNLLDFSCESSGNCCRFFSANLTHFDIQRILENRPDLQPEDFIAFSPPIDKDDMNESFISTYGKRELVLKKKDSHNNIKECVFLNQENRCGIHTFKPFVCRVWPFSLEKGEITWIKEHNRFIKKVCKYSLVSNANNQEELKKVLKQHHKERHLYSKIVARWNDEKAKEIKGQNLFTDILDSDFLTFLLKEININKNTQENKEIENESLEAKILSILLKDKKIECILTITSKNISFFQKKDNIIFDVYVKDNNIESFTSDSNIKNLKDELNVNLYKVLNSENSFKSFSFYISGKIFTLRTNNFLELNRPMPYDAKILYNPLCLKIDFIPKDEFIKKELEKIHSNFLFNAIEVLSLIKEGEYTNCKLLLSYIAFDNLHNIIYYVNRLICNDVIFFENNKKTLNALIENIFISKNTYREQLSNLIILVDFFKKNWDLTEIHLENLQFENLQEEIKNLIQ